MNPKQALEYLYQTTVIEPTVPDEQAAEAIHVVRARIAVLERIVGDMDEGALWKTFLRPGFWSEVDEDICGSQHSFPENAPDSECVHCGHTWEETLKENIPCEMSL